MPTARTNAVYEALERAESAGEDIFDGLELPDACPAHGHWVWAQEHMRKNERQCWRCYCEDRPLGGAGLCRECVSYLAGVTDEDPKLGRWAYHGGDYVDSIEFRRSETTPAESIAAWLRDTSWMSQATFLRPEHIRRYITRVTP